MRGSKLFICICACSCCLAWAQKTARDVDPDQALLIGLALPGSGQVYNGEAWKLPPILGTAITLAYLMHMEHKLYIYTKTAFEFISDDNEDTTNPFPTRSRESLEGNMNRYRRNRDFYIILSGVTYFLQAAEAYVGAHLLKFDINKRLTPSDKSLTFSSFITPRYGAPPIYGLNIYIPLTYSCKKQAKVYAQSSAPFTKSGSIH